jgi:hypothetical protein
MSICNSVCKKCFRLNKGEYTELNLKHNSQEISWITGNPARLVRYCHSFDSNKSSQFDFGLVFQTPLKSSDVTKIQLKIP